MSAPLPLAGPSTHAPIHLPRPNGDHCKVCGIHEILTGGRCSPCRRLLFVCGWQEPRQ